MTRTVAAFIYPGGQSLDVTGPMEVFAFATTQAEEDAPGSAPLYELRLVATQRAEVAMVSGLRLVADMDCTQAEGHPIDTLLVSGGSGDSVDRVSADAGVLAWLNRMAPRVRRLGSVCTGALILAEAGLLRGRRATTHWRGAEYLRQRYPDTQVLADAIYVRDGAVWTSAGVTAGMDLALAMVAEDHGMPLALKVAKRMVLVTKRSGGQTQFSQQLAAQHASDVFAELATWLRDNLHRDVDVATMARQVHMSERHFRRRFTQVFGVAPRDHLERLRIEAAQALLENTARGVKGIAVDCGFASEEALRRAFVRHLGVRPNDYRRQFGALA